MFRSRANPGLVPSWVRATFPDPPSPHSARPGWAGGVRAGGEGGPSPSAPKKCQGGRAPPSAPKVIRRVASPRPPPPGLLLLASAFVFRPAFALGRFRGWQVGGLGLSRFKAAPSGFGCSAPPGAALEDRLKGGFEL